MNESALPQEQLGLFREAFPEKDQIVVPVEIKPMVLEILALLFTRIISEERPHLPQEISHAR